MVQLTPVIAMVMFAYAFGTVWYRVLGHPPTDLLRMMAYPLIGIILGEGLWVSYFVAGPEVLGIHVVVALFTTFIAVSLDIAVESRGVIIPFRYIEHLAVNGSKKRRKNAESVASAEARR